MAETRTVEGEQPNVCEDIAGPGASADATSMANLTWKFKSQGLYKEAAELMAESASLSLKTLGDCHS
jgi:hypothetical protein